MDEIGWAALVGLSLPLGAILAATLHAGVRVAAELSAFGGGILFAAVALELVPEADAEAGAALTAVGLIAGTLLYVAIDALLTRRNAMRRPLQAAAAGRQADMEVARGQSIAAGLTVDGIPESLALGLTIAEGEVGVALLVGIVVGNIVEAYGAAQPIIAGGRSRAYAIGLMAAIGVAVFVTTIVGANAETSPEFVGVAQAVAAGAVLAVISIAVVPHAFDEVKATVAIATILGFTTGFLLS